MNKKTIIILSLYLKNNYCKYLTFVHSHAKEYLKKGYNVIVMAPQSVLPIIHIFKKNKEIEIDGIKIIVNNRLSISGLLPNCHININGIFYYLSVRKTIKKIMKHNNVIMFDAHTFHCEGYTAYLLKKKYPNVKTTITFHGSDLEAAMKSKVEKKRIVKVSKYIDSFICVSDKLTNKVKSLNIKNVKTVYNGINAFSLNNIKKENTIISVGNLVESKRMGLIIDAFSIFNKSHKDYQLKIIGSGYLENDLKKKIKMYDLEDKVFLLGQVSNETVYNELEKSKCFVLPSTPEGFGIVYAEAMYCGCVTVGTKGEGIDGFIMNGKNGFLIDSNVKSIVDILEYVTNSDCKKIIANAKRDAQELTWKKNVEEYLEIIN